MKKITGLLLVLALTLSAACAGAASVKLGSTGSHVTQLQSMLKALGYYSGSVTGHAGEKTVEAIRLFQAIQGLDMDGVAGSATISRLEALANPGSASSSSASSQAGSDDVEFAQTQLKAMGLYYGEITGNIGSKTKAALKSFQKKQGLTADGALTQETLRKLESLSAGDDVQQETVSSAADRSDVEYAQTLLKEMGIYSGEITGNIGTKTTAAIKAYQKKQGLTASGELTAETLSLLRAYAAGDSEDVLISSADRSDVEYAQTLLKEMGIYYGEITGNVGTKTTAAIKAYQKKQGLTANGELTQETLSHLRAYAAGSGEQEDSSAIDKSDVEYAQMVLKEMGIYYGEITGNIGTKTTAAIKAYQKKQGLTASGELTQETLSLMRAVAPEADDTMETLRYGSTGAAVSSLQEDLAYLDYYYGEVTGHYGTKTRAAVRAFQRAKGLTADGIAGAVTQAAIKQLAADRKAGVETGGEVLDLHWFNEKSFYTSHGVKTGATITIMDVSTGKMFNGRVQSTGSHADVEPKTAADTQIMCDIYGVSDASKISFRRRAVLVKANMGGGKIYTYAASMYGEPHGSQVITNNNYEGQFCIHFRHSTTSGTKVEYEDNQTPIDTAVSYAVGKLGMTHITDSDQL